MTAPRLKTPALFLLLLLLSALTGTAFCREETSSQTKNSNSTARSQVFTSTPPTIPGNNDNTTNTAQPEVPEGSGSGEPDTSPEIVLMNDQSGNNGDETLDQFILIGAVVAGIIVGAIIIAGVVVWCRCSKKAGNQELTKEDPHLDGPSSEKVPMPMFEEDVPSVLELEMDELDQWMEKNS
ncbi:transmembrane protein 154 isoform X1 [Xiphophorus maculatus]|uniref:transmembrane protein 154 isoform X1 n=1 Tax=Xiphophorus maculatus TaxID=8083 RepID=UPI000C6D3B32|nr:transmembrane protein 154 isoform X1 [Xiphophorus maculatus]